MDKTWTVVGTSIKRGEKKLRLANGTADARKRVLEKDGHSEVRLFDLPHAMTEVDARAWLEAQGDAVPVPVVQKPREERAKVVAPRERAKGIANGTVRTGDAHIAHEELGRQAYKDGKLGFLDWDDISIETRQEVSRNAAIKAGIKCGPGTYPELEAFYRKEKIKMLVDGTLVQG